MRNDIFNYIISRLINRAEDTKSDAKANPDNEFKQGRQHAYYEVLDMIRNDLITYEYDLKECGLEEDPIKMLF